MKDMNQVVRLGLRPVSLLHHRRTFSHDAEGGYIDFGGA
jgi:hypothetical protein